jgi:hypothetical protein
MEVIVYLAMLGIISILVTDNIISLFKNYNIVRTNQEIEYNAISILDKLTRDVHNAKNVVAEQSSFAIPAGVITLNIASSTNTAVDNKIRFYLEEGKIKYNIDGVYFGNLSTKNVNISNFRIYYINATSTEAIKVELGVESNPHLNQSIISKNFYTTIQLH